MKRLQKIKIIVTLLFMSVILNTVSTYAVADQVMLEEETSNKLVTVVAESLASNPFIPNEILSANENVVPNIMKDETFNELVSNAIYKDYTNYINVNTPALVNEMIPSIEVAMNKYGLDPYYKEWIIALVTQESHGKGNDPFQVSEAYCGKIGCIKDRELSIDQGVKEFKNQLERTKNKIGHYDVKATLQAYNFGPRFLTYLVDEKVDYSEDVAHAFSKKMCGRAGTRPGHGINKEDRSACYGDYKYVEHVSRYIQAV